jgi:hypothetical protein
VRAKVEHVFQVMKLKFGLGKCASGAEEERSSAVCHLALWSTCFVGRNKLLLAA